MSLKLFKSVPHTICGIVFVLATLSAFSPQTAHGDEQRLVLSLAKQEELAILSIDNDGALQLRDRIANDGQPGASCFDSTGLNFYVASSGPSTVGVYRVGPDGFEQLQSVAVPAKPSYLTIDPSGQFLLASYFATGQVSVHRIVGEGRLSNEPIELLTIDERAHGIALDPSGRFAFVPHTRPNAITQLRFDAVTGKLSLNDPPKIKRTEPAGPRHLWLHPGGRFAFGSDEAGRSITAYRFNKRTGTLDHLQTESSLPPEYTGKGSTSHVEVHPNGKFAFIANRVQGSIAVFGIDEEVGRMSFIDRTPTEKNVRSFNLSPDGRFLVAAGQGSGRIVCYKIAADGRLSDVSKLDVGGTPWWVQFYPGVAMARSAGVASARSVASVDRSLTLGQGVMSGEVSDTSVLLQTRLTLGNELDHHGDVPGVQGVACFEWSTREDFADSERTDFQQALPQRDFIVRTKLSKLTPDTKYFFRAIYGVSPTFTALGPTCSFRTLPGANGHRDVTFIVGSCMNYIKFMHGKAGKASGPLTATDEDKRLGFPAFTAMKNLQPEFFVGTGDIVYYDNPYRVCETQEELRRCWHEQFRFPRLIDFFQDTPTYWSKDDHDFRFNDSDNETNRLPLPMTGIGMFREQLPIVPNDAPNPVTYRTIRVSHDVQIWMTEGRDYRSANEAPDGPEKSIWGTEQRDWLQAKLKASDAKWKLLISPTPMVGPDDAYKKDNHASLAGFRHEADSFFKWVNENRIENLFLVCGDRHWQYHSVHPTGVHEFACGALNDENSRMGVSPGAEYGTDPRGLIQQSYSSTEPSGGFLQFIVGETLGVTFFDDQGKALHRVRFPVDSLENK
ncbi:beta-propeller fold lactonase family protein [Rubripirellula tenax]|nr:beta-propeller fold lactonase family protein [Rubripirellula tenax]